MILISFVIFLALAFDFINGFHDAANSIATIVSTRVLKPQWAVLWAAFFNFIAFLFFGLHVANTVSMGIIDPTIVDAYVILSALLGAIIWDLITWHWGIPSSSSHALIGGLAGAALSKGGLNALNASGFSKIAASIVLSPVMGFFFAATLMILISNIFFRVNPGKMTRASRKMQFFSASLYSLGHGGNDAQKTMGIIAVLLYSAGYLGPDFHVPLWIVLSCQSAMAIGTLFGGWKIVKTLGLKITKLKPIGGFCAESGGAITLFLATSLGVPVSTTHTITGSIMGVGAVTKFSAVRWGIAGKIVWAWVITIPASALVASITWWITQWVVSLSQ
jgi:PiT family inorganic phosphate transporter